MNISALPSLAFTDYSSLTQLIVFEPNEVVKEVDVGVIQDSVSEGEEVFMATLVVEDGGGVDVSIEGHGVATITIEDDDSKAQSLCFPIIIMVLINA